MLKLLWIAVIALLLHSLLACKGKVNPYDIVDAKFTKVAIHQHGEKHTYYNADINHTYYLLKLKGNSYQAGLAYGALMKNQIKQTLSNIWAYYYTIAEQQFKWILKVPQQYQPVARALGIKLYKNLLLWNHYITKPYTPKRFLDQYAGMSAGSGIPVRELYQLNMIPEYTRAGCSILGAWGKATQNGDLLQLRALDWDRSNPINKFPLFTVYDLEEKGSKPFVNVGWAGWVGSITGFSQNIGISEKVRKQNPVKQNQTRIGKPWTYVVRDLLQFSETIDTALQTIQKAKRTCSIYLGVGSAKNQTFRLIEYSHKQFKAYDDKNFPYTPTHLQMDGVVFMPLHDNSDTCFNDLVHQNYGKMTIEWMVNTLAPLHFTGDTQMAAYNFRTKELLFQVSYNKKLAFQRPMIRVQLSDFMK